MRRVLLSEALAPGGRVAAGPAESRHVLHVLRARPGERFQLADGQGGAAIGVFVEADPRGAALFDVLERLERPPCPPRWVLLGVPRPALLEEALTLGTEGGATRFLLVRARYSPPGAVRPDRMDRVLRAAVTQCGRADVPGVDGPAALAEALLRLDEAPDATRWRAAPGGVAGGAPPPHEAAVVAIGPEGGWAPDEVDTLSGNGFRPLGLGPFVLRSPSAVGAALARLWPG